MLFIYNFLFLFKNFIIEERYSIKFSHTWNIWLAFSSKTNCLELYDKQLQCAEINPRKQKKQKLFFFSLFFEINASNSEKLYFSPVL